MIEYGNVHMYIHTYIHTYIYMYIEREREIVSLLFQHGKHVSTLLVLPVQCKVTPAGSALSFKSLPYDF